MSEDPDGISRRENAKDDSPSENRRREAPLVNHRAERGGDPGGESPGENPEGRSPEGESTWRSHVDDQQAEGPVVNAKSDSSSENQRGEATVVMWERLLARAGCDEGVIAHSRAVTALALSFTGIPLVNRDLVLAGAMLHDIGRGVTHGISHARRGAALARSYGIDPAIVAIVERHIGAGLTADECSLARLVPRDCVPVTVGEKIVANADNLVHGRHPGCIERALGSAIHLKKRTRRRIYRLYLEMEAFRN